MIPELPILLVEDNDDDAELTVVALKKGKVRNPVIRARDGVEALDYLHRGRELIAGEAAVLPAMVLLDLKLPRVTGLEVLEAVRANPRTQHLPVVILTSSNEDRDRLAAYQHRANSYIQKPVDYERFVSAVCQLGLYWLALNLPAPDPPRA